MGSRVFEARRVGVCGICGERFYRGDTVCFESVAEPARYATTSRESGDCIVHEDCGTPYIDNFHYNDWSWSR
jgi:hypothetical protein